MEVVEEEVEGEEDMVEEEEEVGAVRKVVYGGE